MIFKGMRSVCRIPRLIRHNTETKKICLIRKKKGRIFFVRTFFYKDFTGAGF